MTPKALKQLLDSDEQPVLLDVREPYEWDICRIEGGIDAAQQFQGGPDRIATDTPIVLYCYKGVRSMSALQELKKQVSVSSTTSKEESTVGRLKLIPTCLVTEMKIPDNIIQQCFDHGLECYPEEACGFISGPEGENPESFSVHPMENIINRLHQEDPENHPRTAKDGYMIDPLEQLKLERQLKESGHQIRVIYHSHPDVGAYFSEKDIEDAFGTAGRAIPAWST